MTFRRAQSWVWWLLPFLVARALMPVGFMAQAHDGQLRIVFCSAAAAQVMDADDAAGDHEDATQSDVSCPFAQVAAAPLLDLSSIEAIAFIATTEILSPAESPYYAAGPPRFIATRGPPAQA